VPSQRFEWRAGTAEAVGRGNHYRLRIAGNVLVGIAAPYGDVGCEKAFQRVLRAEPAYSSLESALCMATTRLLSSKRRRCCSMILFQAL
jgi:hypothetical protein